MTSDLDRTIDTLACWLAESRHLVAFTGAGISTDAGIPDFRGPESVWTRRDAGSPPPRWTMPRDQGEPNAAHLALVTLQEMGLLRFVISQNTDDLHRRAGLRPELLAELHGNGALLRCVDCDAVHARREVGWDRGEWGAGHRTHAPAPGQPACPECGGRLISSVVNFGDPLPEKELRMAAAHAAACDVMLVLGSSLVVNPAAALVGVAIEAGARVVLVNRSDTPYDDVVQLRTHAGIGEVLVPAVERIPTLARRKRPRAIA